MSIWLGLGQPRPRHRAHRADTGPATLTPPTHRVHDHLFSTVVGDWICRTCGTVTDFCTQNSPR